MMSCLSYSHIFINVAVVSHSPCCSEDYQEDTWDVYARTLQTWKLTDGMDQPPPTHRTDTRHAHTSTHTPLMGADRQKHGQLCLSSQVSGVGPLLLCSTTAWSGPLKAHSLLAACHTADMTFDTIYFPLMPLRYGCILQLFMVNTSIDTLTGFWDCYRASQNWQHFSCVSAMQALQH